MLENLASHSRVWVYQADRKLNNEEVEWINNEMKGFLAQWASHGNELYGGFEVKENMFLIVAADEQRSPTSGCSIDTLVRKVQELGQKLKVDFFNRLNIAIDRGDNNVELISMAEFKKRAQKDLITGQTVVYNNLIETLADLEGEWKTPVARSWHKNLLDVI